MSFLINPFVFGAGGGGGSSSKTVTIDHTKCGTADSTDWVLAFVGTYSYLADVGHGGQLNSVNNLAFFSDSGLTTLLKFERVVHDLTTGAVEYHVKIPTLSHTTDTVIYIGWDTSNTTDRSDTANVWTANFVRVYHMGDGATLSGVDSTGNGNATATGATAGTGKLSGAASFDTATTQYMNNAAAAVSGFSVSFSAWVKLADTSIGSGVDRVIAAVVQKGGLNEFWLSYFNNSGTPKLRTVAQSGGSVFIVDTTVTLDTNWHLCYGEFTGGSSQSVYLDGALGTLGSTGGSTTPTGLDNTYIGGLFYNTSNFYGGMKGLIDEVRIASVARSPSWILADYNNQNDPSTFYTLT